MYNSDTELLFPLRVIPSLAGLRGNQWNDLVKRLESTHAVEIEQYAFVLMMTRLGGCSTCNADSFRAMRGCTVCAHQTIRRFRGSDKDLLEQFAQCKKEVENFIKKKQKSEGSSGTSLTER
ncbi:MAG: hypothetical protein IT308_12735 [Anaerolineaceae bacterium]|nr:hypothetical protein [Anaerolineaceae bacterium]